MDPRIAEIEDEYKRSDLPSFSPGDTIRVRIRVTEGDKERLQPFEGVVISRRGSGLSETFTVRRVSGGVGVERIFPVHCPSISSVEVLRRGDVRRAKLYYLRGRRGKAARVKEQAWWKVQEQEAEERAAAEAAAAEEAADAGAEGAPEASADKGAEEGGEEGAEPPSGPEGEAGADDERAQ